MKKLIASAAVAAALAGGLGVAVPAAPAYATSGGCGAQAAGKDGRCIIRLSKDETRLLAAGKFAPSPPGWLPWQLQFAYTGLVKGHAAIAGQYANRGWCSAFLMSIYPWENQGYTGYGC
jgi:hypothetical protein